MAVKDIEKLDDLGMKAWDSHDSDAWLALFADRFEWRDDSLPETLRTKEQAREYFQSWMTAFPDMRVKTLNRVVSDDAVGAEIEYTGTNTGPIVMPGQPETPPTNKKIKAHGTYFAKTKNGKITEFHSHPNMMELVGQLGIGPQ